MPPAKHRLATISGIEIQFDSSWFIILALIAYTLGDYFAAADPHWNQLEVWIVALVTTALFFVSVVVHELAHSLVAKANGLPVHAITLFVFGGVSELTREPDSAGSEFRIAVVGPLTSLVLGGICLGLSHLGTVQQPVTAALWWLGTINIILAVFNLVPGFPLDGGRLLRAVLWSANHDFVRATRWATRIGRGIAVLFILAGIAEFFHDRGLSGLWLAFIGWFLYAAAAQSWRQTEVRSALAAFTVRDLETPFYSRIPPTLSLEDYIHDITERHQYRASLVMGSDDQLLGIVSPMDLSRVPRERWATMTVSELMVPRDRMATVAPNEGLTSALEKMAVANVGQLPVMADGAVRGVIRRDRILELLHNHFKQSHEAA